MKLKMTNNKGETEYLNIGFWSFMKCNVLSILAINGIIYGTMIVLMILVMILGAIFS